jgi:hypothetical protein
MFMSTVVRWQSFGQVTECPKVDTNLAFAFLNTILGVISASGDTLSSNLAV